MLKFRTVNILFIFLAIALIVMNIILPVPWYAYLFLIIAYTLLLFWGSYFVQSQFYMNTICKANTTQKQIAISFDDGPMSRFTPDILNILKEANIKASFFCIGKNVAAHPALVKRIVAEGHIIGNHSFSHSFWFDLLSVKKMQEDLGLMHRLVQDYTGLQLKLFRPPYGVTNPNLKKAVFAMNYTAIGWSVRSMDTIIKDPDRLIGKLKNQLKPGAVYLFHDTSAITVETLPLFIQYVKESGFEIIPLEKLLNSQAYVNG